MRKAQHLEKCQTLECLAEHLDAYVEAMRGSFLELPEVCTVLESSYMSCRWGHVILVENRVVARVTYIYFRSPTGRVTKYSAILLSVVSTVTATSISSGSNSDSDAKA